MIEFIEKEKWLNEQIQLILQGNIEKVKLNIIATIIFIFQKKNVKAVMFFSLFF